MSDGRAVRTEAALAGAPGRPPARLAGMPQLCLNIYSNFFELEQRPDGDTYHLSQISEWDRTDQETDDELLQLLATGARRRGTGRATVCSGLVRSDSSSAGLSVLDLHWALLG